MAGRTEHRPPEQSGRRQKAQVLEGMERLAPQRGFIQRRRVPEPENASREAKCHPGRGDHARKSKCRFRSVVAYLSLALPFAGEGKEGIVLLGVPPGTSCSRSLGCPLGRG